MHVIDFLGKKVKTKNKDDIFVGLYKLLSLFLMHHMSRGGMILQHLNKLLQFLFNFVLDSG